MDRGDADDRVQFLTVGEAAVRLGLSRMRIREAAASGVLPSLRDNEGRLRIDLSGIARNGADVAPSSPDTDPKTLISLLFDEIEDLQADIAADKVRERQLTDLAARQAGALDRAEAALDDAEAAKRRLSDLLDRALQHLEDDLSARERLSGVADRATGLLEGTGDRLETSLAQSARFERLLARALEVAETAGQGGGDEALEVAVDKAISLLDQATGRAEAAQVAGRQTEGMLERALAAGERLEREVADRDARIAEQAETVDSVLALSERAVAIAGEGTGQAKKRGFFRRLFGL